VKADPVDFTSGIKRGKQAETNCIDNLQDLPDADTWATGFAINERL